MATHPPERVLTLRQLNRSTLLRQSLLARSPWTAAEAVARLGGLQAQHANSPYVALWSRVADFTISALEAALLDRSVVKATFMRSTLHLLAAQDVAGIEAILRPGRIANWRATAARAGIDILDLHRHLLAYAQEPRSVAEMESFLDTILGGVRVEDHAPGGVRGVAFRVASAPGGLVHVPPSGWWESFARPRYIDVGVWLPDLVAVDPELGLRTAIERYLGAYGPASMADIIKFLGPVRVPPVRAALLAFGPRLRHYRDEDGRALVDLEELPIATGDEIAPNRFLARWDSVVIGYDQRERILSSDRFQAVVRIKNGDFLPTFTVDGFVAGTAMVEVTRGVAVLTLTPVEPVPAADRVALTDEGERLIRFVAASARQHEVRWVAR